MPDYPTPYADVNHILDLLLMRIQNVLGDQFVGMYLYGSLALNDFDPNSSDIDFLVVTRSTLSDSMVTQLAEMHRDIGTLDTKWAIELEGAYIPAEDLRHYDRATAQHPYLDRGDSKLVMEQFEMDWIVQRYVLREHGITVIGKPIQTLIDPISADELCQGTADLLAFWWEPMLKDPTSLLNDGYRGYAIFTMCRILYTFAHGTIISKPAAGQWALQHLDEKWQPLIERAIKYRNGTTLNTVADAQDFIRYTVEQSQRWLK